MKTYTVGKSIGGSFEVLRNEGLQSKEVCGFIKVESDATLLATLLNKHEVEQAGIAAETEKAELKRRADEEAEKARKRVRPKDVTGPDSDEDYRVEIGDNDVAYLKDPRTARVHAYAECMAKVAEDVAKRRHESGYDWWAALAWCADMIADRPSTPDRIQAARDAGFID